MTRVAIVTGGTRGIGRAISVSLRDAGYHVIANYASNDERAKSFSDETNIPARKWDVSDCDACASAACISSGSKFANAFRSATPISISTRSEDSAM